jgi:methylglutaconyl-CoA hydratase
METPQKSLQVEIAQRVATLTLARPEQDNALDFALIRALNEALLAAETDPRVKVIVLRGAGDVFCAGLDMQYLQDLQPRSLDDQLMDTSHLAELFLRIHRHKKPLIAQVQGRATGSGCTLARMCDFVFAAEDATLGYPEVRWGFVPALEAALLPRMLAPGVVRQLLLGGAEHAAQEAQAWQLVDRVVPAAELEATVQAWAQTLCVAHSPGTLELLKRLLADVPAMPLQDGLNFVARIGAHSRKTVEFEIGVQAWLSDTPVEW